MTPGAPQETETFHSQSFSRSEDQGRDDPDSTGEARVIPKPVPASPWKLGWGVPAPEDKRTWAHPRVEAQNGAVRGSVF